MGWDRVEKRALGVILSRQRASRVYVWPPGVPKARVAALRRAFMTTMKDPDFIKAAKRGRVKIEPMSGAQLQARIAKLSLSRRRRSSVPNGRSSTARRL